MKASRPPGIPKAVLSPKPGSQGKLMKLDSLDGGDRGGGGGGGSGRRAKPSTGSTAPHPYAVSPKGRAHHKPRRGGGGGGGKPSLSSSSSSSGKRLQSHASAPSLSLRSPSSRVSNKQPLNPISPKHQPGGVLRGPEAVTDRANMDELVRMALGRQEDINLLSLIRRGSSALVQSQRKRVTIECAYREEWRTGREETLLHSLQSSYFFQTPSSASRPASATRLSGSVTAYIDQLGKRMLNDAAIGASNVAAPPSKTKPIDVAAVLRDSSERADDTLRVTFLAVENLCSSDGGEGGQAVSAALAGRPSHAHLRSRVHAQRAAFRNALELLGTPMTDAQLDEYHHDVQAALFRLHKYLGGGVDDDEPGDEEEEAKTKMGDETAGAGPESASVSRTRKPEPVDGAAVVERLFGPAPPIVSPSSSSPEIKDKRLVRHGQMAAMQAARRYDAAVRMQAFFRRLDAKKRVQRVRRFKQWTVLRVEHWARRLQGFFRRRWRQRRDDEAAAARRAMHITTSLHRLKRWHVKVDAFVAARARLCTENDVSPTLPRTRHFPSPLLAHAHPVEGFDAATAVQSVFRMALAVRRVRRKRSHMAILQKFGRRVLSNVAKRRKQALAALSGRRRMRRRLESRRVFLLRARPCLTDTVDTLTNVSQECAFADAEVSREVSDFEAAWAAHQRRLTKTVLKGKLGSNWVVQENPGACDTFLNLKTGVVQDEHPLMKRARGLSRQQKARAVEVLKDRVDALEDYKHRLEAAGLRRVGKNFGKLEATRDAMRVNGEGGGV